MSALSPGNTCGNAPSALTPACQLAGQARPCRLRLANLARQSEGHAGGGATFTAPYLFELRDQTLRPVFGAPVSMFKNLAGEWNEDGTRQHEISEAANIVQLKGQGPAGYPDLFVRRREGGPGDTYRWSPQAQRYEWQR